MSFFDTVKEFAFEKPTPAKPTVYVADPLKMAKAKIANEANEQIKAILEGNKPQRGAVRWFQNGYVSFKMGRFPFVLAKDGKPIYAVPAENDAAAMSVIKAFANGVTEGEFDNSLRILTFILDLKRQKTLPTEEIEHAQALVISKNKDLSKVTPEAVAKAVEEVLIKAQ